MTTGRQTLRLALRAVLLTLAFALGTAVFGWWAVPLIGGAWGVVGRDTRRPALVAGLTAAVAWDSLLIWDRLVGPVIPLAVRLGEITRLGGVAWIAATVLFPMLVAWAAAEVTGMFGRRSVTRALAFALVASGTASAQTSGRETLIAGLPRSVALSGPRQPVRATDSCVVINVHDGDTITCRGGLRVRLIGMDTPELSQKPFGQAARAALLGLAPVGSTVQLEPDVTPVDRYGRRLAYVWRDGFMANWVLARGGWAEPLTYPPDVQYVDQITQAVRAARGEARGLWATNGFDCQPRERRQRKC